LYLEVLLALQYGQSNALVRLMMAAKTGPGGDRNR